MDEVFEKFWHRGRAVMLSPLLSLQDTWCKQVVIYVYGPNPIDREPEVRSGPMAPEDVASALESIYARLGFEDGQ